MQNQTEIRPTDPDDPKSLYCLTQYFALLTARIPNLLLSLFPLPDPEPQTYRPPHGAFLIALLDQTPIGCVSLRPLSVTVAEVKRLWIAPAARGQGLARRLMRDIEAQARALGYISLQLDTNEHLPEAIGLYSKTGWSPIPPYSAPPATHWFGKSL